MNKKLPPLKPQISIRAETYEALRAYCKRHGTQIRTVVDDLLKRALDAEEGSS